MQRDQGSSRVLCGLWSKLRQVHELAASSAVEREVGQDSPDWTTQGCQSPDKRQTMQQPNREDGGETA